MAGRPLKYPFDRLEPGDSVEIAIHPNPDLGKGQCLSLRSAAAQYGRRYGKRFTVNVKKSIATLRRVK